MQTSADTRAFRPRASSNELVEIGENGLVDLRLATATRRLAEFALDYCGGNIHWAADELGVDVTTVRRWMKVWARDDARSHWLSMLPPLKPGEARP